ncbi:MAG: hypothetical protein AAGF95_29035 [Chloroflexota bacterium]
MSDTFVAPSHWSHKLLTQIGFLCLVLVVLAWFARPDGRLHVVFLDTKGDAMLIQTPAGGHILIDGGSDPVALTAAIGRRMPFWQHSFDAVVLTKPDDAHLPGQVAALARYSSRLALVGPVVERDTTLDEWLRLLEEERTPVRVVQAGEQFHFGGVMLRVLATGDTIESGMLLRLEYGATSVVFNHVGGIDSEDALIASGGLSSTDLVVFPWQRDVHIEFVERLSPRAFVLTDGAKQDHPVEQTFVARSIGGAPLYHERLHGQIEWISDGRQAWIITEE